MSRYLLLALTSAMLFATGCSSAKYKTQEYAKLSNTKDFEDEYKSVWRGVIDALSEFKIEEKDQDEGKVVSDWIYTTSNDKFLEYNVNGFPRRKYLQTRLKYLVTIEKQMGKNTVTVDLDEEIEALRSDGSFDTWKKVSEIDSTRANDMLKTIELKILSRPDALNK